MSSGGQVLGGVVGTVAGFFLGGGPTGALYGAQIGMMAGGYLDPPKGPTIEGPRLDDLSMQTSTYGAVIPRVYGTAAVNGNVFWLENNRLKETVTKKKSGGKGGGGKTTTRTYTYSATFAVGLCKGPIAGVRRIWVGPDLIYDAGSSDPDTIAASNAAATGFKVYLGTDTQAPDARIQATLGVANTPAWRGLAYLVFYDLGLARYANSLAGAQVRVEVVHSGHTTGGGSPVVTAKTFPTHQNFPNARFAFVGTWGIASRLTTAVSPDCYKTADSGETWAIYALPSSWYQLNCVSDGARVCILAKDPFFSGSIKSLVSSNGTSWVTTTVLSGSTSERYNSDHGLAGNGVNWCVAGSWLGVNYVSRLSVSGGSWVEQALPTYIGGTPYVVNLGGRFMIFHDTSTTYYTSDDDGVSWTSRTLPFAGLAAVAYGGSGNAHGITNNGHSYSASSDSGTTWSTPTFITAPSDAWGAIGYCNGWILVQRAQYLAWSEDGVSWTLYLSNHGLGINYLVTTDPVPNGNQFFVQGDQAGYAYLVVSAPSAGTVIISDPVTLGSVVSAECLQSGLLTAGDIDVTALTSTVRGYRIGSVGAIRAALEPLQASWPFDVVQHGYQITFVARGGASVVTIPAADLDARGAGQEPGVQITSSREMDSQLPRRVTVQHLDYDREYNAGTQYAERLNTAAINARVLDLPIVLTATEAAGKAEVLLYLYWLERYDVAVTLPPTYNQLEPGDVVTLVTPEGNVSLRLTAIHYTSDGRLECQAKYASAAIYTPTAVGSSPAWTGPTTITPVGASVYVLLDVPMINSAQSGPSFLVAMTGALAGWGGGVLMQSTDAGSTWASLQDFGPPGSSMGICTNSIGVVEHRMVDSASLLNVTLTQGALYSVTQLALLGGANHFAYGADGRWEIIAAQTCTLVSGTSYVLQNLLRGRFGSEWAMGLHAVGDALVLLDTTDVAAIAMSAGTIGLSYLYRGVTVDRDISTDSNRAFAYQGVNLRPLSPIALTGSRDPSSNDWSLTWIRRTRDGGEWRDYVDASLGEASESYAIDVYSDGTYTTVKRTISASSPSCVYASADQVSDFGANQATLYLKLYQISATVGRGYPLTTSITR
ncbi:phage tail protein [Accumulibacter sp.]|uniref:phage tail protein n=1 Tax=Accumulibacter sp. TaxID=2053492 RepID=UPI0026271056|nr:phage tail protein [Accumulibacter sp.]